MRTASPSSPVCPAPQHNPPARHRHAPGMSRPPACLPACSRNCCLLAWKFRPSQATGRLPGCMHLHHWPRPSPASPSALDASALCWCRPRPPLPPASAANNISFGDNCKLGHQFCTDVAKFAKQVGRAHTPFAAPPGSQPARQPASPAQPASSCALSCTCCCGGGGSPHPCTILTCICRPGVPAAG